MYFGAIHIFFLKKCFGQFSESVYNFLSPIEMVAVLLCVCAWIYNLFYLCIYARLALSYLCPFIQAKDKAYFKCHTYACTSFSVLFSEAKNKYDFWILKSFFGQNKKNKSTKWRKNWSSQKNNNSKWHLPSRLLKYFVN